MVKLIVFLSLFTVDCFCMQPLFEADDPIAKPITVTTRDEQFVTIDSDVAECMGVFDQMKDSEDIKLSLIDAKTLHKVIELLKDQKQKPTARLLQDYDQENKNAIEDLISLKKERKIIVDYYKKKEDVEMNAFIEGRMLGEKEEGKEAEQFSDALKQMLKAEENQAHLRKKIDSFFITKQSIEEKLSSTSFYEIIRVIQTVTILDIKPLIEPLIEIASSKEVSLQDIVEISKINLKQEYIDRIAQKILFQEKKTFSLEALKIFLSPHNNYLIFQGVTRPILWGDDSLSVQIYDFKQKKVVKTFDNTILYDIKISPEKDRFGLCLLALRTPQKFKSAIFNSETLSTLAYFNSYNFMKLFSKNITTIPVHKLDDKETSSILPLLLLDITNEILSNKQKEQLWNAQENEIIDLPEAPVVFHTNPRRSFNEHTKRAAVLSDKYITVYDSQDGFCVKFLEMKHDHRDFYVKSIKFSPQGNFLAACGNILTTKGALYKPTLKIWETSDWSCVKTIIDENSSSKERECFFLDCSFSEDEKTIAITNPFKKEIHIYAPLFNKLKLNNLKLGYLMSHIQQNGKVHNELERFYKTLDEDIKNEISKPQWQKYDVPQRPHYKKSAESVRQIERRADAWKAIALSQKASEGLQKSLQPKKSFWQKVWQRIKK